MFPTKEQLEQKWWYRLFRVFLYASTVIIAIIFIFWALDEGFFGNWQTHKYIYSFEKDYFLKDGDEKDCTFELIGYTPQEPSKPLNFSDIFAMPKINCGDLNQSNFIGRYCAYAEQQTSACKSETLDQFFKLNINQVILSGLKDGSLKNVKSKYITETHWGNIFGQPGLFIAIVVGWFLLLKLAVYPAILYISYGKRK